MCLFARANLGSDEVFFSVLPFDIFLLTNKRNALLSLYLNTYADISNIQISFIEVGRSDNAWHDMASAADTALNTNKQSTKVSGITDKKVFLLLSLTPVMLHQNFNASAWNHVNADVSSDTAIKKWREWNVHTPSRWTQHLRVTSC